MGSAAGEWITNIAVIAILGALIDIILPNSSFRKYTGFILGLVILAMFLQPILKLLDQAESFDVSVFRNAMEINTETASFQSSQLEEKQKQQMQNLFKESLEKELAYQLETEAGLENAKVVITFRQERGETDLSSIERIDVTALQKEKAVSIQPVEINLGRNSETGLDADNEKASEIKGILSRLYGLEEGKIFVNGK